MSRFNTVTQVGSSVSSTLAHEIVSPSVFKPESFAAGMFASLVGSFSWVTFATYFALPGTRWEGEVHRQAPELGTRRMHMDRPHDQRIFVRPGSPPSRAHTARLQ